MKRKRLVMVGIKRKGSKEFQIEVDPFRRSETKKASKGFGSNRKTES